MKINVVISKQKIIQPFNKNQDFEFTHKMCAIDTENWNYQ